MKRLFVSVATLALIIGSLAAGLPASAAGSAIPAHAHWDVHSYTDHEIQLCYDVVANNAGFGSTIAFLPLREVDSQNFMELDLRTSGFALKRRVSGVFTTDTPTFTDGLTHSHGVGSKIMVDFTMIGSTFTLYLLNPDLSRGAEIEQWLDSTYPSGVNISYYTQPHWQGEWDFVHAFPVNGGTGQPHDISNLAQDARVATNVCSEATFDDSTPANGDASGITGSTGEFGLASGTDYQYTFTVSGSGSGYVDFRDPEAPDHTFYDEGFYRLTFASPAKIQRYNGNWTTNCVSAGSTAGSVYTASAGGAGSYTLTLTGPNIYLYQGSALILGPINDGGPQSGVRVRVNAGTQTISWTGTVQP